MKNFIDEFSVATQHYWNSFTVSLPKEIIAIVIEVVLSNPISNFIQKPLAKSSNDPLTPKFLTKALKMIFIILVIMMALYAGGFDGIAAGILVAAIVLGFAFKDTGENFIKEFILAFNRPINFNDIIMVNQIFGKVKVLELCMIH